MTNPDNAGGLPDEIESRLTMLQIGTCSCGTKTPEARLHLNTCKYRAAVELRELCRAPGDAGGLPELPEPVGHVHSDYEYCAERPFKNDGWPVSVYEAHQVRAYGELCRAAPAGGAGVDGEMFICYLIDKCERETISEESLHEWLADFLKNPRYHRPSAPAGSGEVDGLARWWQAVEDDMMRDGLSHPDHHVVVRYVGKHERADLTAGDIRAALLRKLQQGADGQETKP